ncbi:LysR family transcriptional regulator [Amnibacterium setariae]|uniref:LysR family transcriptional regulator n=1 Tax=Amnibacterium setariae TaxID=2306585 RepID=A0A3A1TYG0_9MICO|nr:LysR family transcriptional regulator [Amnibacterium setariae]RIX28628.1 LysR family transcriptional regulator [Amnibacterium setariae]
MELRDLETFVVVAEELHFARAAARLHVVPAAVTQRIQLLEQDFGVQLFSRSSRRVAMTAAGLQLVEAARDALARVDAMRELAADLSGAAATKLSVAVGPNLSAFLGPILARLTESVPALQPTGRSMWSDEAASAVQRGEVDAAILRGPVLRSGLDELVVGETIDTLLAIPDSDPLARVERPLTRGDLDGRPVLLTDRAVAPGLHDRIVAWFADADAHPRWRSHRMQSHELLLPFVAISGATALVHDHMTSAAPHGVSIRALAEPGPRSPVLLVTRSGDRSGPVRALRGAAVESQRSRETTAPAAVVHEE